MIRYTDPKGGRGVGGAGVGWGRGGVGQGAGGRHDFTNSFKVAVRSIFTYSLFSPHDIGFSLYKRITKSNVEIFDFRHCRRLDGTGD